MDKEDGWRIAALTLLLTALDRAMSLFQGGQPSLADMSISIMGSGVLALYLYWLAERLGLRRRDLATLLTLNLFIVGNFSNQLEGYFFTDVFDSVNMFVIGAAVTLIYSAIQSYASTFLLPTGEQTLSECFQRHFSSRDRGSWAVRVIGGTVIYFPVYFFFGALISPFILPYYSDPAMGLTIPPFSVIIPLEILRGFLYVVCLVPIITCIGERRSSAIALIGMLFIPGALLPLLVVRGLPTEIIPYHLVEILGDSIVYGYILVRLLGAAGEG